MISLSKRKISCVILANNLVRWRAPKPIKQPLDLFSDSLFLFHLWLLHYYYLPLLLLEVELQQVLIRPFFIETLELLEHPSSHCVLESL